MFGFLKKNLSNFFKIPTNETKIQMILFRNKEELASWQSLENLKNLENLRSSTQNPVEKDFFFQSLNEEKCLSAGSSEDCEELFDV